MNELMNFLKDVFLYNDSNDNFKIGLSQFKDDEKKEKVIKKEKKVVEEIKLSDLMRRSA